jgi:hypothetical protein
MCSLVASWGVCGSRGVTSPQPGRPWRARARPGPSLPCWRGRGVSRGLGSPQHLAQRALPRLGTRVAPPDSALMRPPALAGAAPWPTRMAPARTSLSPFVLPPGAPCPQRGPSDVRCGSGARRAALAQATPVQSCVRCALCPALGVARRSPAARAARSALARPRCLLAVRQRGVCAALRVRVLAWCARCLGAVCRALGVSRSTPPHS